MDTADLAGTGLAGTGRAAMRATADLASTGRAAILHHIPRVTDLAMRLAIHSDTSSGTTAKHLAATLRRQSRAPQSSAGK